MRIEKLNFSHLTKREQGFLIGGLIVLFFLLFYFWIWSPFRVSLEELRESAESERALNQWTKTTVFQIKQHRQQGVSIQDIQNENLLSMIEDSIVQEKLNTYVDNVQEKERKIMVSFRQVPFDRMIEWLEKIWKSYAISIYEISTKKGEEQGTVQSYLLLQK